ncbi:MAG: hypothetical protein ACREE7_03265, partial [Dongiaceae bacterium]
GVSELRDRGATRLLSFGYCGGLDGTLSTGDVVIADAIIAPDGRRLAVDGAMRQQLEQAIAADGLRHRCGPLLGVDAIVTSADRKRTLAAATGAIACDMESHAMAFAAAGALPIGAVRVVVDPASRSFPASVVEAMGDDGRLRPTTLLRGLLRRPADIVSLPALARDSGRARPALRRAAAALGRVAGLV